MKTQYYGQRMLHKKPNLQKNNKSKIQMKKSVAVFLIVMAGGFGFLFQSANANERKQEVLYYESVEIKKGDTIWGIAKNNKPQGKTTRIFMDEIYELNQIDHAKILPGQHILIPVFQTDI